MTRLSLLPIGLLSFSVFVGCRSEETGPFPSRPIDVVTHASPGGGTDATARAMLVGARAALGVGMAVVPKVGGSGLVAMSYVDSRPRDGYTLMGITPTHLFALARRQGPLTIDDFVGVARATDDPIVVMVKAESDLARLEDLVALGRERPIKWGTTQIGSVDHVAGARLGKAANTQLTVVPFGGGGEIVTNLMAGNIDAAGLNLTEGLEQIRRGEFRALAVMADERMSRIADVPTTVELGYDVRFSTVRGYVVLAGTPPERVAKLEKALLEGLRQESYQTYLERSGLDPSSVVDAAQWDRQIREMYERARAAMVELGHRPAMIADRAVGAALVAFSAAGFAGTTTFREVPAMLSQNVPPTFFPRLVLAAIGLCGLLLVVLAGRRRRDTGTPDAMNRHVVVTAAILVTAVALIPVLGMLGALFAVVVAIPWYWGERRVLRVLAVAAAVTTTVHVLFGLALGMRFPPGLFG